jgi:hypothetical protein
MSANIWIAAAAVAFVIAPALGFAEALMGADQRAQDRPQWAGNAISGAYAAANKSRRAVRPASRGVSQATDSSIRVTAPGGRDLGTDPDAAIRFQIRRDSSMGGM